MQIAIELETCFIDDCDLLSGKKKNDMKLLAGFISPHLTCVYICNVICQYETFTSFHTVKYVDSIQTFKHFNCLCSCMCACARVSVYVTSGLNIYFIVLNKKILKLLNWNVLLKHKGSSGSSTARSVHFSQQKLKCYGQCLKYCEMMR